MREEREKQAARAAAQAGPAERKPGRAGKSLPEAKEQRRKLARMQELENRIAVLESELGDLAFQLENPPEDPGRVARLGKDYARVQAEMDALLVEWEQLGS